MIFSIVVILLVGVIGYFYFVQGLFTGALSAISATLAGVLSISYYEPLTASLFQNKFVDSGNAISLLAIFAVSFVVLRVLFDKIIPGNIRLQSTVDGVGGAVMGLVVGIFATGILAVAAQSMPFGPSIMGQTRYKTMDTRSVTVPGNGQAADESVSDELVSEKFEPNDHQTLLLPVDDWVVGFVSYLSNGGSLAGDNVLTSVHPALLDEFFGQRIGIQPGVNHVIIDSPTRHALTVPLAYLLPEVNEADSEIKNLRTGVLRSLKPQLKSEGGNDILVIRLMCTPNAADTDQLIRMSPGAIRLLANGVNYTPIGSLDSTGTLLLNKPDDAIIVSVKEGDAGVDLVFNVPAADVLRNGSAGKKGDTAFPSFQPGAFLEVKREARIDLSDVKFTSPQAPDGTLNVLRKKGITQPMTKKTTASIEQPQNVADADPVFDMEKVETSAKLFHSVAVGLFDGSAADVTFASGSAHVDAHQFTRCTVNPIVPLKEVGEGDNSIQTLAVPAGMRMVQFVGTPPARTDDPWMWATHLGEFSMVDSAGGAHKPAGAFAKVFKSQQPMMMGVYESTGLPITIAKVADARPTDVWLMFSFPERQRRARARLRRQDAGGDQFAGLRRFLQWPASDSRRSLFDRMQAILLNALTVITNRKRRANFRPLSAASY